MAQTLTAPGPEPGRISQILPSVKCSTCGKPVPIAELGDHVCAAPPPMPAASAKPPMSPTSPSFFQQKYQNLISANRPATPKASPTPPPVANAPPRLSSASPAPRTTSPLSLQRGSLSSSSTSSRTPSPGPRVQSPLVPPSTAPLNVPRADRVSSQYARAKTPESSSKIAFPSTTSGPPEPSPRIPSPLRHHPSEPTRVSTTLSITSRTSSEPAPFLSHDAMRAPAVARTPSPGVASFSRQQQLQIELGLNAQQQQHQHPYHQNHPPPGNVQPLARPRAPSTASTRSTTASVRQPTQSGPAPYSPGSGPSSTLGGPSQFQQRPRAATDIGNGMPMSPPLGSASDVIYSTPHTPSQMRGPPLHLNPHYAPPGTPQPQPLSPHGPSSPAENIDTKIGGEAGMAGVGRRGFAAAARAAMFAHQVVGGGHLSINTANTPPLSPGSTASPRSPYSQQSPLSFAGPTSPLREGPPPVVPLTRTSILTRTPSPLEGGGILRERVIPPASEPPKVPLPATPSTPSMPFFEKFKNKIPPPIEVPPRSPPPHSASSSQSAAGQKSPVSPAESEFEGLAYIDSSDEDEEEDKNKNKADGKDGERARTTSQPTPPANRVRFPSLSSSSESSSSNRSESRYSSGTSTVQPLRLRSLSASTTSSTYTSKRATMRGPPRGLELAMETLLEEEMGGAVSSSSSSSGVGAGASSSSGLELPALPPLPTLPPLPPSANAGEETAVEGDDAARGSNSNDNDNDNGNDALLSPSQRESISRPKLPARANTTPGTRPESRSAAGMVNGAKRRATEKVRRVKTCLKCQRTIEDGKWIQMEGAGVMCDRCWKNMYLPKCRRCNLVIEKQAVSSSDGQLKGKYHRDCFNCHTCHKPFPDKEFYVFDGKPFCKYHYHEENNSLCAATLCGQPIEGPCAVAHNGDRYHPEHLTCEHPRCSEKLVDYWEVDGRMFCDKHAQGVLDEDDEDVNYALGNHRDSMLRATKRRTRFIDLTGFAQPS